MQPPWSLRSSSRSGLIELFLWGLQRAVYFMCSVPCHMAVRPHRCGHDIDRSLQRSFEPTMAT